MLVKVRNYQAIKKADLEFVPGINLIIGSSDSGKSSLYRALSTALFNLPRESHISYGQNICAVGIAMNGHTAIYKRDKNKASSVSYTIDGETYAKLGRGQFDKIAEAFNIKEADVETFKVAPNFSLQMSYPFMLDKTPGQLFKFVAQSSESGRLLDIQDKMKKDLTEMQGNLRENVARKEVLKERYNYEKVKYNSLLKHQDSAKKVLNLDGKVTSVSSLNSLIKELSSIDLTPKEESLKKATVKSDRLKPFSKDTLRRFEDLDRNITSLEHMLEQEEGYISKLDKINPKLVRFPDFSEVDTKFSDLESIKSIIASLEKQEEEVSYLNSRVFSFKDVPLDVDFNTLDSLGFSIYTLESLNNQIEESRYSLLKAEKELSQVLNELKSFDICPFCGSVLNGGKDCGC